MSKGVVRIYGCGGFGINTAHRFNKLKAEPGQADVKVAYIDTSRSNLQSKTEIDPSDCYILPDVDGSGKIRRDNHEAIGRVVKNVLQDHQPADFNIVVFSGSGGSGSVIGPLILAELLARDLTAVAIVVGSTESNITSLNTLNTLKSLDSISHRCKLPVVMHYSQNTADTKRSDTDHAIWRAITMLTILNSRENAELDTRDVQNFVQYTRSTSVPAGLAMLEVFENNAAVDAIKTPITIASLYKNPDEPPIKALPEYSTVGYPQHALQNFEVLHFVIDHAEIGLIAKSIQESIDALERQRQSRIASVSLVTAKDQTSDDGLVF